MNAIETHDLSKIYKIFLRAKCYALTIPDLLNPEHDLATQFVDLIQHQRSFQASSRTITTADEMMQELVNLKR